jgi:hypothetical protein
MRDSRNGTVDVDLIRAADPISMRAHVVCPDEQTSQDAERDDDNENGFGSVFGHRARNLNGNYANVDKVFCDSATAQPDCSFPHLLGR